MTPARLYRFRRKAQDPPEPPSIFARLSRRRDEKRTAVAHTRIPESLDEQLQDLAERLFTTKSTLLLAIIETFIQDHGKVHVYDKRAA